MSESRVELSLASGLKAGLVGTRFRTRIPEQTIAIDVGASTTKAEISRAGFAIGEIQVKPELIATILDKRPRVTTKVVMQSIEPGTAVAIGTAIDLVIISPDDLPVGVVPGAHKAFVGMTMSQLYAQFADQTQVRDIVRTRSNPADLTTSEIDLLTSVLHANNVDVGGAVDETVGSAFTALQAAFTFQG